MSTAWDLGVRDKMSVWFYQTAGREVRLIHYEETTGKGFPGWARRLQERARDPSDGGRGFVYDMHLAPHDIGVIEQGTGKTRLETARELGIHFKATPRLALEDGLELARSLLDRTYIDRQHCQAGIDGLRSYRFEMDEKLGVLSKKPLHDWASDPSDAYRTLAVGLEERSARPTRRKQEYRWMA